MVEAAGLHGNAASPSTAELPFPPASLNIRIKCTSMKQVAIELVWTVALHPG